MEIRPILFSTPMVQAILDGRKTQTRRTKGLQLYNQEPSRYMFNGFVDCMQHISDLDFLTEIQIKSPYGNPGDVLWVRESFHKQEMVLNSSRWNNYIYKADHFLPESFKWKPSIHMPKEAARLFLKITDVRVERLCSISGSDALAEGLEKHPDDQTGVHYKNYQYPNHFLITPKRAFQSLWEHINGEESWNKSPWVWVIEFERIEKPLKF